MPTQTGRLTNDVLNAALAGLEAQRQKIDDQIQQVRSMLGVGVRRRGRPPKNAALDGAGAQTAPPARKRRRFSAETRARMRAAQQKRWASAKKQKPAAAAPAKKHRLSAAGRKRIIEATKKRWAAYKAAKKTAS